MIPVSEQSPPPADDSERWGTKLGVILAVAGSAVGLGNFLRFPGQAVAHGGGAFIVPYLVALVLLGLPLAWAEWTMGRYGGRHGFHSAPGILGVVSRGPAGRYLGCLGLLVPIVIYMYYVLIEAWCLRYAWEYVSGGLVLGSDVAQATRQAQAFFGHVSGAGSDGFAAGEGGGTALTFWIVVMAINLWFVHRGLSRGIEIFCSWAMPCMALCAIFVLVRVLTLGTPDPAHPELSVQNGLGFLWNPDFSKLGEFGTWLAAASQIFFSLSVGFGVIINYASYLRDDDDVVLSCLTACSTNELFEVGFGGLITVTAAFVFLGASGATGGTFGLGFQTLPIVFSGMGSIGRLVGAIWFGMLFLAALTSSLSMLQPFRAFLREGLGLGFRQSSGAIALVVGLGSAWVFYFSRDLLALDTLDFWVGTFAIFILAAVQTLLFGWTFGVERGVAEAHRGARMRLPRSFAFVIRYIAPLYLAIILVGFMFQGMPDYLRALGGKPVARYTIVFAGVVFALLIGATAIAERRWKREGLPLNGPDRGGDV